ncbi:hypothetical protein LTR56_025289 [Elasticomyces elasticus]|nr:hypothetical protein LTR56_025289 [Elasticomyces elasticus]KAK3618886.1 hypothetical protein LTR22_026210 [Elasticomyces elasticus]KAK4907876.1 hypothetical protein LTR49_023150 [Elasticomyces elasticus]KAK5740880.1 hypothetical protein LTS12_024796 [Elasticomyces elasticus]
MSAGFSEIAAAIGVAELALRSISRIYEFVRYLKDVPESVARLSVELSELNSCLSELVSLETSARPTRAVIQRLELSATVSRCGETCSCLEVQLRKWTQGGRETLVSRLRVRLNKTQIETAIQSITSTKETIILAVSIASFRLQSDIACEMSSARGGLVLTSPTVPTSSQHELVPTAQSSSGTTSLSVTSVNARAAGHCNDQESSPTDSGVQEKSETRPGSWDMEVQLIQDNEVAESQDTKIGTPSSFHVREQKIFGNKVVGSTNTSIGRF